MTDRDAYPRHVVLETPRDLRDPFGDVIMGRRIMAQVAVQEAYRARLPVVDRAAPRPHGGSGPRSRKRA